MQQMPACCVRSQVLLHLQPPVLFRPPQNFEWLISDDTILPMDLFYNYVFRAVAWPRDIDFTQAFPPSEF